MIIKYDAEARKGRAQVREAAERVRRALGLPTPAMTLLAKMQADPAGTVRTPQERIAFERYWDYQVDLHS